MTKDEMVKALGEKEGWVAGKKVKIDFGDQGVVLLDGVGKTVSTDDGDADTTIKVSWADWESLGSGQLDPMTAFMQGKVKVEGDMANAMQLQGVLAKLKS